jgi:hypothetical protein
MLTGGITRRETAEKVLDSGAALVGVGTALSVTPDLPDRWRAGRDADRRMRPVDWSDKALASAATMAQVHHQMRRWPAARPSGPAPTRRTPCSASSAGSDGPCGATAPG